MSDLGAVTMCSTRLYFRVLSGIETVKICCTMLSKYSVIILPARVRKLVNSSAHFLAEVDIDSPALNHLVVVAASYLFLAVGCLMADDVLFGIS